MLLLNTEKQNKLKFVSHSKINDLLKGEQVAKCFLKTVSFYNLYLFNLIDIFNLKKYIVQSNLRQQLIKRSDNLALSNALRKELMDQTPYVQRYLQKVKEYNLTVIHVKGTDNVIAEALGRQLRATTMYMGRYKTHLDYDEMWYSNSEDNISEEESREIEEQKIKPEGIDRNSVALLQQSETDWIETAQTLKKVVDFCNPENVAEIAEVGNKRAILPESMRLQAFNAAH